jgi:hypothetical protein
LLLLGVARRLDVLVLLPLLFLGPRLDVLLLFPFLGPVLPGSITIPCPEGVIGLRPEGVTGSFLLVGMQLLLGCSVTSFPQPVRTAMTTNNIPKETTPP